MRLGCRSRQCAPGDAERGFNEAEAHAPRMPLCSHAQPAACSSRFNEAEAHAPRMPQCSSLDAATRDASMRPRRVRLGCVYGGKRCSTC